MNVWVDVNKEGSLLQRQQEHPSDMLKYFHSIIQAAECHVMPTAPNLLRELEEQKCVSLVEQN